MDQFKSAPALVLYHCLHLFCDSPGNRIENYGMDSKAGFQSTAVIIESFRCGQNNVPGNPGNTAKSLPLLGTVETFEPDIVVFWNSK